MADLEYAHETLGAYDKAAFFDPDSPEQLAVLMKGMIHKKINFQVTEERDITPPFAQNWQELFDILLSVQPNRMVYAQSSITERE